MADTLPIDEILPDVRRILNARDELVLEAPPGAGKTTRLPLALLNAKWLGDKKVLLLQPRRVAARAAAERMASSLGEPLGGTIGYRIRDESKIGPTTKIEVITEGILSRQLIGDPGLESVGLIIFDEFHERSLDSDFGLALCKQTREFLRDSPLKIIVMSASLGKSSLCDYLGDAPLLKSEGRLFPVDLHYHKNTKHETPAHIDTHLHWLFSRVVDAVQTALAERHGSILVFLPGRREIAKCLSQIKALKLRDVEILPLHGGLTIAEQREVIRTRTPAEKASPLRRIILSTDIAETSLTIDGVDSVIDSGLARVAEFDPNTATSRLKTRRISKASSIQRAGRAGRLGPGACYRLWTESQQHSLNEQRSPEILTADLAPLALQIFSSGADSTEEFSWLDAPPRGSFDQAKDLLRHFQALEMHNGRWRISEHGKKMASLPTHPRLAHLLIRAASEGFLTLGANIAALLAERDTLSFLGADFNKRLDIIQGRSSCPATHRAWQQSVKKQSQRFSALAKPLQSTPSEKMHPLTAIENFTALAFPDRIAKKFAGDGVFKLSNGRNASLNRDDNLSASEWLVVVDLGGSHLPHEDRIYSALALEEKTIEHFLTSLVTEKSSSFWDEKTGRFIDEAHYYIGHIKWKAATTEKPNKTEVKRALLQYIQNKGLAILEWSDECNNFLARLALAHQYDSTHDWPDMSMSTLEGRLEEWLAPYLNDITSLSQLKKLPLLDMLKSQLEWSLQTRLNEILPQRITVPSGTEKAIDYSQTPPVLAVKLQEMFGVETTPSLLDGKIRLSLHLLSPARRPLQITQDLAAFWRNGYQEVKKEMRGRYPKHPWPDDPLQSAATALTKKRLSER